MGASELPEPDPRVYDHEYGGRCSGDLTKQPGPERYRSITLEDLRTDRDKRNLW
ncbi:MULTISPECIES: hypothetical protein [unclassified Methanoculleus]|uniref:Uncharacterized protein n=1 Tax=Methanoculleus palmolei TaxID=72612 RepID=A0ABD8ABP4_9EURY|nr:hypothetical protein [Methanoculleus sp. UBA377]WOX56660.1 hypothetical protein R6Y95_04820 [Methanoculleus palmolei]